MNGIERPGRSAVAGFALLPSRESAEVRVVGFARGCGELAGQTGRLPSSADRGSTGNKPSADGRHAPLPNIIGGGQRFLADFIQQAGHPVAKTDEI
jgi:hypothetical protein